MNELTIRDELKGLEASKAKQIEAVFAPMVEMLKGFEGEYDNIMALEQTKEKASKAKRLRLDIAKIRIEADKVRKVQKDEYLRAGNAIQGVYNILKFAVTDKEDALKDVELYYERIEAQRLLELQLSREAELAKYEADGSAINLGAMDDQVWENFRAGTKANYEAIKAAEKKAEEDRVTREKEEKAEQARIRAENVKLQKEREAMLAQKKKDDEAARKIQEKAEAELRAKNAEILAEKEKRAAVERKIAQEKAEVARVEAERLAEQKRKDEAASSRSDGEKLAGWADALEKKAVELSSKAGKLAIKSACIELRKGVING